MPLINPIFGLPFSAVDRVSENEDKKKRRDKSPEKEDLKNEFQSEDQSEKRESNSYFETVLVSQLLDTNTIVKLIEAHLECQKTQEHSSSSAANLYNHVKNITQSSVYNRTV